MNRLLLLNFLIVLTVLSSFAQDKKKNPSRETVTIQGDSDVVSKPQVLEKLLYKAPKQSELKEFVSENKTFSIIFPGIPEISKQDSENYTMYRVSRQGGESVVINYVFENDVNDIERVYELTKKSLLYEENSNIQAEKNVLIEGIPAKEIDVVSNYQFQKVRVLIIGNKIYHIINLLKNWRDLNEKKVVEFKKETTRFFNSFKVTSNSLQKR